MIGINIEMPTYCYDCPCHNGENGRCNVTGEYTFDKRPFDCPLCDVNEVKHAKWIQNPYHDRFYTCSKCGRHVETYFIGPVKVYPFCSNCGAKMDEDKIEENEK